MAVFSTNQNRQFYVASEYAATVNESSATGTIGGVKCVGGGLGDEIYFLYKGVENVLKSDRIPLKNLDYMKLVEAADMRVPLKKVEITLNAAPVVGQDYVLRINFRQFYGMSDEDQYFKDAAVHATSAMSNAKGLFDEMVNQLNLSFSRELGATKTENPYLKFEVSGTGANAKLVITEKAQEWTRGLGTQERVLFDIVPTTIYNGTEDVIWGTVTDATPTNKASLVVTPGATQTGIGNGTKIADLEWFCLGERGDQYRMMGYPNYIPTKYQVNEAQEYYVLELHYAFTDTGVNSYRSEKDITVVSTTKATLTSLQSAIEAIINPPAPTTGG
jgi:hypothetical protein